jgi:hypothetical protein
MSRPNRASFVGGNLDGEQIVFTSNAWPDSVSFRGDDYELRLEGDALAYVYVKTTEDEEATPQT